jgi:phage recombination protein Bet
MTKEMVKTEETKLKLSWSKSQMDLIKRTVAKGSTNDEFNMFMYMANTYQLDPIMKEIWFIKYNEKAVPIIMTSRDGYLAIANRNPHYAGLTSDVVHENDEFEKVEGGVKHKYGCKDRGKIIGAYALGYRVDRKYPVYVFAHFNEYFKKNSSIWTQYGSAMILKVAEAMMLKRLFSISGLVTREEMATEKDDVDITPEREPKDEVNRDNEAIEEVEAIEQEQAEAIEIEAVEEQEQIEFEPASDKQIDFIYGADGKKGVIDSHLIKKAEVKRIGKSKDLSKEKAGKVLAWWWGEKDKNIIGERERREKNPKTGDTDLERREALVKEVLALFKKNFLHKPMQKKFYEKYQKADITELAYEELEELKELLLHYVPDWK